MAGCSAESGSRLIFSCSGAADVGELADKACRKMTADGTGKMFCLAGIGGKVPAIMDMTSKASEIIAVDGCGLDCVANCLKQAGFTNFKHMVLTDMGYAKGNTSVDQENVSKVASAALDLI